jgi:Arc/MetJ-type ribon-helix-helix transcriptional regulator
MKLFTVKLTEDERAKLEAHRARLGCRSQSDVIRYWIELLPRAPQVSTASNVADTYQTPGQPKPEPLARTTKSVRSGFKSRLKGEWKAP